MTGLVDKVIAEEHHLEEVAREGYEPATLAILLVVIFLSVLVIVGLALGISLAVYYLVA
jgi:hypothetical protein